MPKRTHSKACGFRDHRAFSWVLFEAGSQLTVPQYESTEALNLHLKGFDNKERELFVLLCHEIDQLDFLFMFFAGKDTKVKFASKLGQRDLKRNFCFEIFRM